jgi:type II secretory pathway pseudopilin PulG
MMIHPKRKGYTLWELLIVVFIVMILVSGLIPMMRGHINDSKWTEGITAAGMIQNAAKAYYAQTGIALIGRLNNSLILGALNLEETDLTGRFFVPGDYEIVGVDVDGKAAVRVTGSLPQAPAGSKILTADGRWE